MDMNQVMKQAQMMQLELARAQEEVQEMTFMSTAGWGLVVVVARGDNTIERVTIAPEVVDPDDVDMLQDMILVAVNSALNGVREASEARLAAVTGGMNIPGLF